MNEIMKQVQRDVQTLLRTGEVDCGGFVVACVVLCVARDHGHNAERAGPHVRLVNEWRPTDPESAGDVQYANEKNRLNSRG